jgi:hypothetical protein
MEVELRNQLLNVLQERFNEVELRDFVFRVLGPENQVDLAGDTLGEKAISLLEYLERHDQTDDLINYINEKRQDIKLITYPVHRGIEEQSQPLTTVQITVHVELTSERELRSAQLSTNMVQAGR